MSDQEAAGETKPKVEGNTINLVVKDQTGGEVQFKVKKTTKFEKIHQAYCAKKSVDSGSVRFIFDGDRVNLEQTPADMDMVDGDSVDAVIEQVGGQ